MAMVSIRGQMGESIEGNTKMISNMGMEFSRGQMDVSFKETGTKVKCMERECSQIYKVSKEKGSGLKDRNKSGYKNSDRL